MVHTRGYERSRKNAVTHEHTAAGHTQGAACTRAANEVAEATGGLDVGRRRGSAAAHRQCRRAPPNCRASSGAPSAPTTCSRVPLASAAGPSAALWAYSASGAGGTWLPCATEPSAAASRKCRCLRAPACTGCSLNTESGAIARSPERAWDLTAGAGEARRRSASCGAALRETARPRRQRRRLLLRLLLPLLSAAAPARL